MKCSQMTGIARKEEEMLSFLYTTSEKDHSVSMILMTSYFGGKFTAQSPQVDIRIDS